MVFILIFLLLFWCFFDVHPFLGGLLELKMGLLKQIQEEEKGRQDVGFLVFEAF